MTAADTVSIRRARQYHAGTLSAICRRSKAHWGYPEHYLELWADSLTVEPSFIADNPVYAAVGGDGRPLGFYGLSGSGPTLELDYLFVDPPAIGRGIGGRLLRHAAWVCRRSGARRLWIVADPNAESFYRHMGARRRGEENSVPRGRKLPVLALACR